MNPQFLKNCRISLKAAEFSQKRPETYTRTKLKLESLMTTQFLKSCRICLKAVGKYKNAKLKINNMHLNDHTIP
jgi:hypothetical protein